MMDAIGIDTESSATPNIDARRKLYETLTDRERDVARMLALGRTCRQIGEALNMSQKTAESHRGRILDKLHLDNTTELARDAIRVGFVPAPDEATA